MPESHSSPDAGTGPEALTDRLRRSPSLEALRDLVSAAGRVRRAAARRAGLGETEMLAMQHLMPGALGPAEVARLLEVSTAASTGIVDRLVARGHVERQPHPADRRRVGVHVTESGRDEVRALLAPMFVALARLDAQFDDAEREVVTRYLRAAVAALDAVADETGQPPPSEA